MCIVKQYRYHYIDGRYVDREKRYHCSEPHCHTTRIYQADPEYETYPMARPLSDFPPDRNNPNTTGNGVGVEFTVNNMNSRRNTASGARVEPPRTVHVTRHIYPVREQNAHYQQQSPPPALHSAPHAFPIPAEANFVHVIPRQLDTPPLTPRSSNRGRSRSRSFSVPFREHRRRDYHGRSRSAQGRQHNGRGHSRPRQQSPPRRPAPAIDLQAIADHIHNLENELERARRSSAIESEIRHRERQLADLRERRREEELRRTRLRAARRNPAPIIHQDNPPRDRDDGPREHERRPATGGARGRSPSHSPTRGPSFEERGIRLINESIRERNNPRPPRLRGGRDESLPRIGFAKVLEGVFRKGRD